MNILEAPTGSLARKLFSNSAVDDARPRSRSCRDSRRPSTLNLWATSKGATRYRFLNIRSLSASFRSCSPLRTRANFSDSLSLAANAVFTWRSDCSSAPAIATNSNFEVAPLPSCVIRIFSAEVVTAGRNTPRSVTTLNCVAIAQSDAARTAASSTLALSPIINDLSGIYY